MNNKDMLARSGETAAARYLADGGLTILARNWQCPAGELDIVARAGRTLVVCEVKTRTGTRYGHPAEAVTLSKLTRLRRLAATWLTEHGGGYDQIRIDILALTTTPTGFTIDHIPGVG